MARDDVVAKPTRICSLPDSKFLLSDFLPGLTKACVTICILFSISLLLYAVLFSWPISSDPARFFSILSDSSPAADGPVCSGANFSDAGPTRIHHLLFGLGGSAKTWKDRKHYTELWWAPNSTRGFVWLDEGPEPNVTWPETSPPYRVCAVSARKSSDRMARILKEGFEQGLPEVRWFVMGDDDTVFFTHNLVSVLSKYDHRQMYYIGGSSESVEQDVMHGYGTAFGGGGFAVSYPLACELVRILDGCIERYHSFYGSDEKVSACVAELGVPLTRESGFHQLDIREDPYGFLAAHPMAPLVSLHHLDYIKPLFPGQTQMASLQRLMGAYHVDPARILQQSICYDHRRKWSVSISWGYTAQIYPSLISSKVLGTPLRTFRTWRSWHDGPFVFNTRPLTAEPCEQPIIYFLDHVEDGGNGKTITVYKQVAAAENEKRCNQSVYESAMSIQKIKVSSLKTDPEEPMKAPRRQCCEILRSWTMRSHMRVKIRSCKPGETMSV